MSTVSIIIPAYNHAAFLKHTLESILQQTWQDFEIIVVDDGSRDETAQVAAGFGSAVTYIYQTNRGMAATRNTGIRHASGTIISFIDDDDLWLPNYLETVVPHFQADASLAALHTGYQLTSDKVGQDLLDHGTRTVPALQLYSHLIEGGFFPPSSVSVRRSCLDQVGVFDETLQGYADWELWLRICREHKFIGIPDVLVKYRIHAGGLSSNVQHMTEDRLRAVCKHFGPAEGPIDTWPIEKRRAYGFAYRTAAFEYSIRGQQDEAWRFLEQAVTTWPEILGRLDTFYELACGTQPRGYRGQVNGLDIDANGAELLGRLEALFAKAGPALQPRRRSALGHTYLALSMLSDQAGRWDAARNYLSEAIKAHPRFLTSYTVDRRFFKLLLGSRSLTLKRFLSS